MSKQGLCPTCNQTLPQAQGRRICADCANAIRRHDKWFIGSDGKLHHKDCANTEGNPATPTTQSELLV